MEEEYKIICDALIALCQRENVLSTDTENLMDALEGITGIDRERLEELID